jgi:hypothetical protein
VLAATLTSIPVGQAGEPAWKEFRWKEGKCTVHLPAIPQTEIPMDPAKQPYTLVLPISKDAVLGLIIAQKFPEIAFAPVPAVEKMLDDSVEMMFRANPKDKILKATKILLEKRFPGRELLGQMPDKQYMHCRFFMVGSRVYIIYAMGTKEFVQSKDAVRFLDSLRIDPDAAPEVQWKDFVWREGACVVWMPATPQSKTEPLTGPGGEKSELHLMWLDLKIVVFMVGYNTNAALKGLKELALEQVLDGIRDRVIGKVKGQLIKETTIKHAGIYFGREILFQLPDKSYWRERMFIIEDRAYQLAIIGSLDTCQSKEADEFFTLFKILK